MSDRDLFAAAALTGFLASLDSSCPRHAIIRMAYEYADAMLQERVNHPEKPDSSTNHDAAPAARASESPCAGHAGTGGTPVTKPMPVFVSGSGSVTPVAYQENDEKRVFYDTTGGQSDRTQPIENGPDADSRVWETPAKTDTTPPRNGTPAEGSVPGEGTKPDSRNWREPVAWAVEKKGYPPMFAVFNDWNFACRAAMEEYAEIVPLYRHPPCQDLLQKNLTDEELEAVRSAFRLPAQPLCSVVLDMGERPDCADTLRNLLERTK